MPKTRQQKEQTIAQLNEKLEKASSLVFADYQGLTMSQLSTLRRDLRQASGEFTVTKNNLLRIALEKRFGQALPDESVLEGPVATLFAFGDEISPIKTLTKAFKDFSVGTVKGGFLASEFLSAAKVTQLAALPGRDELRAKVVGGLGAPLYGIVGVLQANLRNLVYTVDAIRKQKGG